MTNRVLCLLFSKSQVQKLQCNSMRHADLTFIYNSSSPIRWSACRNEFTNCSLKNLSCMKTNSEIAKNDSGVILYHILKGSRATLIKFLWRFYVTCPHSTTVKRCVSKHNMKHSDLRKASDENTVPFFID